jgi:hypothetical protein
LTAHSIVEDHDTVNHDIDRHLAVPAHMLTDPLILEAVKNEAKTEWSQLFAGRSAGRASEAPRTRRHG